MSTEPPLLSINRGFSAPVIVDAERRAGRARAAGAGRHRPVRALRGDAGTDDARARRRRARRRGRSPEPVIRAIGATLKSNSLDPAFKAEAILLPSESLIADRMEVVDPDAIHAARERLRAAIGAALRGRAARGAPQRRRCRATISARRPRASRRLRTVALGLHRRRRRGRSRGARQGAVRRAPTT